MPSLVRFELMDVKSQIRLRLKEAQIYQTHGLFGEAKTFYREAVELIRNNPDLANRQKLLGHIAKLLKKLNSEAEKIRASETSPELTELQHQVVKEEAFVSKDGKTDAATFQVAATLLGFGQFNKALHEFNSLLKSTSFRVPAAKNILRCQVAVASTDKAVKQYSNWLQNDRFPPEEIATLRSLLLGILKRKGIEAKLPELSVEVPDSSFEKTKEDFSDIISVMMSVVDSSQNTRTLDFDVSSQSGGVISVIVPREEDVLIDRLNVGSMLEEIRFFTPEAMFSDDCTVTSKTRINSGPKSGDWAIVMRLLHKHQ
ncbi:tetratricopeptide repeat protein [Thermodesulfobacteriota bacterium]